VNVESSEATIEVRACRDRAEFNGALNAIWQYFNAPPDEDMVGRWVEWVGLDRMHAAFDDGEVVGGAGAFTFDFTVPGGSIPCAGVTVVGVYPTHRRRGILREMMRAQLADVHERGEPIAALWASEETIYGRFGYGLAAWCGEVNIPRDRSAYARPFERRGRVRSVTVDEAAAQFPAVWDALRAQRPGVLSRSESWWRERVLRTPDEQKATPKRLVALDLDGSVQGYAIYKTAPNFEGMISNAKLEVVEAVGATPQATAEIWRFLLDIDWMATIRAVLIPPDHPLFFLLANPRRARFTRGDSLWVRLVDVGAALSGREYRGDGRVVFEVRDATCPWNEGRWKLEGGGAERTEDEAEIALDVDALGSAYLGAVSFAELRDGLRLEERVEGAVARADALFGWQPLPWCPEIF
jgi:predicted acetyltransferase